GNFHSFAFAEGGLVRRPVLGLIGEAGPEHVLRVDSPASIRALREGLRPIIAELVGASGGASNGQGGGRATTVNVDLRGSFFPDARAVERLFRLLEAHGAGRRVFQPARA
ncbi:MAG: hypothetical protein O2807_10375, partial [bacterium]|nr:hypothetical protein [bacterium]